MKQAIGAPFWDKKPVVLVACGPSLRGFEFNRLLELDAWLVGVNESIFHLPRCDAGISVDRPFVDQRFGRLQEKINDGMEMIISTSGTSHPIGATFLPRKLTNKLSDKPDELITCGTSGYGALNVAYLKRAKKGVLLLGYDYSADGAHYFEDYEWNHPPRRADCWSFWAGFYASMLPQLKLVGIEVFNASPKSIIKAFPRGTIDEGLQWLSNKQPAQPDLFEVSCQLQS